MSGDTTGPGNGFSGEDQTHTTLQRVLLPTENRCDRIKLYVDYKQGAARLDLGHGLPIECGSIVGFCTFFNAFSHRKWASLTGLEDLSLQVCGLGTVEIVIATYTSTGAAWEIHRASIELREIGTTIALPRLSQVPGEVLAFEIHGTDRPASLFSCAWVTAEPSRRDVSLAAVITTFGREEAVKRSMDTFSKVTCDRPSVGSLELYVIDNGRKLGPSLLPHVTVFPNPNLGGAGGFARGLIEAMDAEHFTHVLFMDDDAACEPESVWRSMALLGYMQDAKATIAGAMLLSDRHHIQYEKGARLDKTGKSGRTWIVNNHYFDLSDFVRVCDNESDEDVNYGAWWFFAFPLCAVKYMPFPFFVRGDDVDFSMSNDFNVVTLNGVATWCDSFGTKLDAATEYLQYRAWTALTLMHGTPKSVFLILWNGLKIAEDMAYRFNYAAMNALLDAIEDAMRGPEFFRDNPAPLEKIKALKRSQPPILLSFEDFKEIKPQTLGNRSYVKRAKRSFAGHMRIKRPFANPIRHTGLAWEFDRWGLAEAESCVFGRGTSLQMLRRSRKAFFQGKWRMTKILWLYRFRISRIQERYKSVGPSVRTRSYWQALFDQR